MDLDDRLRMLATMDIATLRAEWRRLYRVSPPPRLRRDLLTRGIADKWQEAALGGLPTTIRRRLLAQAAGGNDEPGVMRSQPSQPPLRPGIRLLRTWRGRTMSVTVLDDGFLFEERRYTSLTEVAQAITRSHWSGPRFFGLAKPRPTLDGTASDAG